jgi:hypothetical protein
MASSSENWVEIVLSRAATQAYRAILREADRHETGEPFALVRLEGRGKPQVTLGVICRERKSCSRYQVAQMIRASLLATCGTGRPQQRAAAVNQQHPQVSVATLADPAQSTHVTG